MKRILVTGINSYVGNSFATWVSSMEANYSIDFISLKSEGWKELIFSKYDVIFHVAGIAHVSTNKKFESEYYRVNRDLTIDVAKKAKNEGVNQFVFMSSIIVYGDSNDNENITKNTIPNPSDFYGLSKLQAENGLRELEGDLFKVAIVRPPMIYGKGSRGNYLKLSKLSRIIPVFPRIDNKRSAIHIDNLCEFIRLLIDDEERGVFHPQNDRFFVTSEIVDLIARAHGRKIFFFKQLNPLIRLSQSKIHILKKLFGNLAYDDELSIYNKNYQIRGYEESIELTEKVQKGNKI